MNMGGDPTEGAKPSSEKGGQASGMAGRGQRARKAGAPRTLVEMNSWPGAGVRRTASYPAWPWCKGGPALWHSQRTLGTARGCRKPLLPLRTGL